MGEPKPVEVNIQQVIEQCKDPAALGAFIRERTLHGVVRLGFELQTAKAGKEFLDVMKLWERVLMSMPTGKDKAKRKKKSEGDE